MTSLTECADYHESVPLWMEQNQIESATTSPLELPLDDNAKLSVAGLLLDGDPVLYLLPGIVSLEPNLPALVAIPLLKPKT